MKKTHGFTLVELLVVIAIIGILIALLLPAVQAAREAARRMQCSNNLKQIALALHNFESTHGKLPAGGVYSKAGGYGHSWWTQIMPYLEQKNLYDQFDFDAPHTGWLGFDASPHNAALLRDVQFEVMRCPSSPLPPMVKALSEESVMSANYVGIAGATDHPTAKDKPGGDPLGGAATGRVAAGGVLILHRGVSFSEIRDGTTNTLAIGEQSDWCRNATGELMECRSDCDHGFAMGPGNDGWERHFNLTIALHRVNDKSSTALGVAGNCGPNRPLQSAHPGGAQGALADGSVQFLSESLDIQTIYDLANRDDGNVVQNAW
ncbi:MAG: DUF1559 domain-containing protein [Pirellulales bacterium]